MKLPDEAYNAGKLLDAMRPGVEKLLEECRQMFGKHIPGCPSQSHRAIRALQLLDARVKYLHLAGAPCDAVTPLYHLRERLEKFLAVHQTVCLLETLHRNPDFDVFGHEQQKQTNPPAEA